MGWMWSLLTILGPILLIGFIIFAVVRNRQGSRADVARAERGAAKLREDIARDPEYRDD